MFQTPEFRLRTTGRGETKLQLENQGKRTAHETRLALTAVQGRERLVALTIGEMKWDIASEKQLSFSIRELTGGASTTIEMTYEVDFSQRASDTLSKASAAPVELRIEVASDSCPRVTKIASPSVRLLIEPEAKTAAPVEPALVAPALSTRDASADAVVLR